ncbi:MarR family winged helix-turn-helix transcriptional regulator [Streptomyces sp. NPDC059248]|uniref:MarR family winged helix-turn-helix transcriptional regulator n=1 Tax=Streptomyces sp. NPDC059248 TaxID=3346791 RepID=UPI0036A961AE
MASQHPPVPEKSARAIADAWSRELPGVPVSSIGVVTPLWRLAKLFGDDRRRVLARVGVDAATLDLLSVLRRSGPPYTLTTRELGHRSLVTAGAVSQRVARAETEGLVTRTPLGGRPRTVEVTLTPTGHALVESTVESVLGRESELLTGLTPEERGQLATLLEKLFGTVAEALDDHRVTHVGDDDA